MASSVEISKFTGHSRSVSLPSRCHPLTTAVEDQLDRLRSSEATSSSVCQNLRGLKDLYESINDLLQLPLSEQAISDDYLSKCIEQSLGGSIRLLDFCGTIREVFSQMKECVQGLESSLRRKRGGDSGLASEVETYIKSKKRMQKVISKISETLKRVEKKKKDSNKETALSIIREAEDISLSVFESLLCLLSGSKAKPEIKGWSLVSKLVSSKHISCEENVNDNNVEGLYVDLSVLKSVEDVKPRVLKRLEASESTIQDIEEDLECLFRHLVKTRASLLNVLNH
ncbi:uncharacterized protein LOC115738725 [Rhodamnia argentea]|uniref:Uncharacterized protein LOC115738725 n=1 Tax=Rhodamnia argentea TaxID=178133 RepID=A0A8B8NXL0_9MYRT|nr:uncharacterized protein LOC115738725 [Rhodamnia argentea]